MKIQTSQLFWSCLSTFILIRSPVLYLLKLPWVQAIFMGCSGCLQMKFFTEGQFCYIVFLRKKMIKREQLYLAFYINLVMCNKIDIRKFGWVRVHEAISETLAFFLIINRLLHTTFVFSLIPKVRTPPCCPWEGCGEGKGGQGYF